MAVTYKGVFLYSRSAPFTWVKVLITIFYTTGTAEAVMLESFSRFLCLILTALFFVPKVENSILRLNTNFCERKNLCFGGKLKSHEGLNATHKQLSWKKSLNTSYLLQERSQNSVTISLQSESACHSQRSPWGWNLTPTKLCLATPVFVCVWVWVGGCKALPSS